MNSIKVCFQFNSPAAGCYEAKMNPNLHHIHMMGEHIRFGSGLCSTGGRLNAFENKPFSSCRDQYVLLGLINEINNN